MNKKTIIVGGVAGGASAAARLRRLDEKAEIIMFERGEYISFANCGLPYFIGGVIQERDALLVQTVEGMSEKFNMDIRIFSEVISIQPSEKKVTILMKLMKKVTIHLYFLLAQIQSSLLSLALTRLQICLPLEQSLIQMQ